MNEVMHICTNNEDRGQDGSRDEQGPHTCSECTSLVPAFYLYLKYRKWRNQSQLE